MQTPVPRGDDEKIGEFYQRWVFLPTQEHMYRAWVYAKRGARPGESVIFRLTYYFTWLSRKWGIKNKKILTVKKKKKIQNLLVLIVIIHNYFINIPRDSSLILLLVEFFLGGGTQMPA